MRARRRLTAVGGARCRGWSTPKLAALGIALPAVPTPIANFVPFRVTQGLVFLAGQTCEQDGRMVSTGARGRRGRARGRDGRAARVCALNLLAALRARLRRRSRPRVALPAGRRLRASSVGLPGRAAGDRRRLRALRARCGARTAATRARPSASRRCRRTPPSRWTPSSSCGRPREPWPLRGITKRFGATTAVDGVDLDDPRAARCWPCWARTAPARARS